MKNRALILGPNQGFFTRFESSQDVVYWNARIDLGHLRDIRPSLIISYGYRFLVPETCLEHLKGRFFNVHISLLPWNRGADPNLWSWLENTPRGVSIHHMTSKIDEGPLVVQHPVELDPNDSLAGTYAQLHRCARQLILDSWGLLNDEESPSIAQSGPGTEHKAVDKDPHLAALTQGWNTPCREVLEYGRIHGLWVEKD